MESTQFPPSSADSGRAGDDLNQDERIERLSHRGCPIGEQQWSRIAFRLHLTPRELQIVRSLFEGLDEKQIAVRLELSRHTVHTHLGRLYRKLEVDSARGLLLRVFREILPPQG